MTSTGPEPGAGELRDYPGCRYQVPGVDNWIGGATLRISPLDLTLIEVEPSLGDPVAGIGDRAQWQKVTNTFVFVKGEHVVKVGLSVQLELPDADYPRISEQLARLVESRLP